MNQSIPHDSINNIHVKKNAMPDIPHPSRAGVTISLPLVGTTN